MRGASLLPLVACLSGCMVVPVQTWDEVPTNQKVQTQARDRLAPGDVVRVRTIRNKVHLFRVYRIDDTAFYGVADNHRKYRVPFAGLASIEVRRIENEVVLWAPVYPGIPMGAPGSLRW